MRTETLAKMILLNSNLNYYKEDLMKKIKRKHNVYKSHKMSADKAVHEMTIQKQLMYLI